MDLKYQKLSDRQKARENELRARITELNNQMFDTQRRFNAITSDRMKAINDLIEFYNECGQCTRKPGNFNRSADRDQAQ
jgi:hypothetical protein